MAKNMHAVPSQWRLPETIRGRLGERLGRQRAMVSDGHLLLILHEAPAPDVAERRGVLFWRAPSGEWSSTRRGGPGALGTHLGSYEESVGSLEKRLMTASGPSAFFSILEAIAPLERACRNQLAALQAAREEAGDKQIISLRDRAEDIARRADLIQSDAKSGLDFSMAKQVEEQARVGHEMARAGHRLNLIMAVFLPLTALGSMLGMNMDTGLEHLPSWSFWLLFGGSLFAGILLSRLLMGRAAEAK